MKCCKTISIEQKYGKYLFEKKIKTKKIVAKQISIQTKEEDIKKDFESQIKDANEEKKKFIQIIQSFEDPLSQDNINLENISFFSDIKNPDSELTIQLNEELPKIRDDSIKYNLFDIIHKDINLMDIKNNYFIEPLLNNFKFNRKNIKIVNNEIPKNINKNDEKNEDSKEAKEDEKEQKENEDEKKEKIEVEQIENIETEIKKKNIIVKSLIYFNRDITVDGIENFKKRTPDYNKSKFEEDNKLEKNIYVKIEDRIREILNKSKSDKLSLLREFDNNYLLRISNFEKKSINYKNLCLKGIIIGLLNIINDWAGKEYLKFSDDKNSYENDDILIVIFEKYEILKKICFFLEKDFKTFIDNFKENNKLDFNLVDLFSDIFWDYIFRIKEINIFFTNNYNNEKISKKLNEIIENIINILFNINSPYKKLFGEILDMKCIKQEKIYLMNYIIKYKKPINKNNTINNSIENNENQLHTSSSCDKILNNELNNIEKEENKKDNIEEEKDNSSKNINISNENINNSNDDCNNISNSISNDTIEKENDLSLGKSLSMDAVSNKLSDKDSLEKVYNYILYGESESIKKKQKKKHKKKKKNKNNIIIDEENNEDIVDPVVEEYKNYINDINKKCSHNIKKIKPKIKEEWINYISTSIDE